MQKNERLLKTIRGEPVDATPIWIMRQAGRYLPEYRAIRQKAGSFMALCKTPELACEVTLQPLARYPLDAAILFSDILTIPDAMGLGLHFKEGEGPFFTHPLRNESAINALPIPDPDINLRYVLDAIRMIQHELAGRVPLIGFCGSPWTMATYMVEGNANKSFPAICSLRDKDPRLLHRLLHKLSQAVSLHLSAQINAGVQVVMLFDTWGGMLNTSQYQEYSLRYMQEIITHLKLHHHAVPIILFTKGGGAWLDLMAASGCDVIGVDWLTHLGKARQQVGATVALQGNMNPSILCGTAQQIKTDVARILKEFGSGSGHIFNLGHGITPDISPDNVAILVDAVHSFSASYHLAQTL